MQERLLPYKILCVEDERETRENFVVYLKTIFSYVYEAEDGEEGYKVYEEKKPHIMIIDINLPKLNGLNLLKRIRQKDHTTKAIMLTAHTDQDFLLEATALKLSKYLVKPVKRKDFKDTIRLTLEELETYQTLAIQKITIAEHYYWDTIKKELICYAEPIELTANEKKLLEFLLSIQNKVFSYDAIFEHFWQEKSFSLNSLKNLVKRLRKKLPPDTLVNVFNEGYKINCS